MNRYLLVATVQDRIAALAVCLRSVRSFLPSWRIVVVTQGYSATESVSVPALSPAAAWVHLGERVGPHDAKLAGLSLIANEEGVAEYAVCSSDDDMEFTARTNLEPCVRKIAERGVGLVSAGWVKHENKLNSHPAPEEFVRQPIVYTGGGLVFGSRVARVVMAIAPGAYFCDNSEWSLAVYRAGYDNYRYRGSVTIHRICGAGGRRAWVKGGKKLIPDERYLKMKPAKVGGENAFHVGGSSDLTQLAHDEHNRNAGLL